MRSARALAMVAWKPVAALVGAAALVVAVVAILKWVPESLSSKDLAGRDRAEDAGRIRTALLALIAGLIAVTGAVFTGLSYRLGRAGQITERFTRAVDQLGSATLDVRLGGIYALERIARDSKHDQPQVLEVLTAFIREHAPWPPVDGGAPSPSIAPAGAPIPATDVQAVVEVLGRRKLAHDGGWTRLNLVRTDLRGLKLLGDPNAAHFERSDLTGAHLEAADIPWPHFEGARLADAHLEHACFAIKPYFTGADLTGAHLQHARLSFADFEGATLRDAHLEGAALGSSSFEWADLTGAHLHDAVLDAANLSKAALSGADLDGARLHRASLAGASFDADTRWPAGFDARAAGAQPAGEAGATGVVRPL